MTISCFTNPDINPFNTASLDFSTWKVIYPPGAGGRSTERVKILEVQCSPVITLVLGSMGLLSVYGILIFLAQNINVYRGIYIGTEYGWVYWSEYGTLIFLVKPTDVFNGVYTVYWYFLVNIMDKFTGMYMVYWYFLVQPIHVFTGVYMVYCVFWYSLSVSHGCCALKHSQMLIYN